MTSLLSETIMSKKHGKKHGKKAKKSIYGRDPLKQAQALARHQHAVSGSPAIQSASTSAGLPDPAQPEPGKRLKLVEDSGRASGQASTQDPGRRPRQCLDCGWEGPTRKLKPLHSLKGLSPGEIIPLGECPECGNFIHLDDDEFSEYILTDFTTILAAQNPSRQAALDQVTSARA